MEVHIDKAGRDRTRRSSKAGVSSKARAAKSASADAPFTRKLLEAQRAEIKEELGQLLSGIDKQAAEIEKSLTFESLEKYRELVRKFVNVVVNDLFAVEEKLSVSPTGKKKSLLLVKTIDAELAALAEEFVKRQTNLLAFMARLDRIRGLLLDMYT